MSNIIYIDDALATAKQNIAKITLNFLEEQLPDFNILGFGREKDVFHYFFNINKPLPNLLICDHNLYWGEDESMPYGYKYRYADQLIGELQMIRGSIEPIIIYSDSGIAEWRWKEAKIPYVKFVPKWENEPWKILTQSAQEILRQKGIREKRF